MVRVFSQIHSGHLLPISSIYKKMDDKGDFKVNCGLRTDCILSAAILSSVGLLLSRNKSYSLTSKYLASLVTLLH